MRLERAIDCLNEFPRSEPIETFRQSIEPHWIEEALLATGTATVRKRRLDACQVVWLVIGMALFRNRPITEIVDTLDLVMPKARRQKAVAASSVVESRKRLGEDPLAWLFVRSSEAWGFASAKREAWRGFALFGVDGTTMQTADTPENRRYFGLADGGHRGKSGYPLVRLVALMALRSHVLCQASFGPYQDGEYTYAEKLWSTVIDNSLTILDKNFLSAGLLLGLNREGHNRHWLLPCKSNTRWNRLKSLGPNDELVEMTIRSPARKHYPWLPKSWVARAIHYQCKGFRPRTLLTSLMDEKLYPAQELIELYHERWEIELGYGEMKTRMMDQTHTPLRSKTKDGVCQEIWGLLIAYNLVRLEMERIADEANVKPTRIRFVMVYRMICDEWLWCSIASPGAIPKHLRELREAVKRFILPERRSERSYPRAVKVKMSNYAKKHR